MKEMWTLQNTQQQQHSIKKNVSCPSNFWKKESPCKEMPGPQIAPQNKLAERQLSAKEKIQSRIPSSNEWWAVLTYYLSGSRLRDAYFGELEVFAIVQTLLLSFAYPLLFEDVDIEKGYKMDIFNMFLIATFISSLTGLCVIIATYVQLNLCIKQSEVVDFFREKVRINSVLNVPMVIGILLQATLIFAAGTCVVYSLIKHSFYVQIISLIFLSISLMCVGKMNIGWEVKTVGDMSELLERVEENSELIDLMTKNNLSGYIGNVVQQVHTVDDLKTSLQELQLSEVCDLYDVPIWVAIRLRNIHDTIAIAPFTKTTSKSQASSQKLGSDNKLLSGHQHASFSSAFDPKNLEIMNGG